MATNLSNYFRQQRLRLGLRPGDVARRMGYKSIVGAANKIVMFEERGDIRPDLFEKLRAALEIDETTIQQLLEQDHRAFIQQWNEWANQPIEPHLIFRALPGVYFEQEISEGVETPEEMEQYAAEFAGRMHKKVWLVLSRRLSIFFDEDGTKKEVREAAPGELNSPYMQVGNSRQKFIFSDGMGMRPLTEPEKHGLG